MKDLDAGNSGSFRIGGEIAITRLGFGSMRLTGAGSWGEPTVSGLTVRSEHWSG
jgi:pyridoxine 4-dehydrogenase